MPPSLPLLSGRDIIRVFISLGWHVARQNGSHIVMIKDGEIATLSIPDHKEVARGTLRSLIRATGLTVVDFIAAIR